MDNPKYANYKLEPDEPEPVQPESEDNELEQCIAVSLRDLNMNIDPREWIYGTSLVRGMLSILGGVGGVGKTSYVIKVMLSIALGRPLLALDRDEPGHTIYEPQGSVWYYSLEDPMDELIRRVKAEILDCGINTHTVADKVFLQSGRNAPLIVAKAVNGEVVRMDVKPIVRHLIKNNIVVAAIDPFANSFEGADAENTSDFMKVVLDQWRIIAHEAHCAIWLVHHFRKGGLAGDADAFRGSSVIQNAARVMETLTTMTIDQAKELSIPETERRNYVRLENAKVNLSPAPAEGQWFKFVGVPLGNRTEKYPKGDIIGVLKRWKPVEKVMTWQHAETILDAIEQGDPNGMFFSSSKNSEYWAGSPIMAVAGFGEGAAAKRLKEWLDCGLLTRDTYKHPKHGKKTEKLVVNPAMRTALIKRLSGQP
jgi:AAA domain